MSTSLTLSEATKNAKVQHPLATWQQAKEMARIWMAGMYGFKIDQVVRKTTSAKPKRQKHPLERALLSHPWWKLKMEALYEDRKEAKNAPKDPDATVFKETP